MTYWFQIVRTGGNPFKICKDGIKEQFIEKYHSRILIGILKPDREFASHESLPWCVPKPYRDDLFFLWNKIGKAGTINHVLTLVALSNVSEKERLKLQ